MPGGLQGGRGKQAAYSPYHSPKQTNGMKRPRRRAPPSSSLQPARFFGYVRTFPPKRYSEPRQPGPDDEPMRSAMVVLPQESAAAAAPSPSTTGAILEESAAGPMMLSSSSTVTVCSLAPGSTRKAAPAATRRTAVRCQRSSTSPGVSAYRSSSRRGGGDGCSPRLVRSPSREQQKQLPRRLRGSAACKASKSDREEQQLSSSAGGGADRSRGSTVLTPKGSFYLWDNAKAGTLSVLAGAVRRLLKSPCCCPLHSVAFAGSHEGRAAAHRTRSD